jgi:hypothetical protein
MALDVLLSERLAEEEVGRFDAARGARLHLLRPAHRPAVKVEARVHERIGEMHGRVVDDFPLEERLPSG